MTKKFFKGFILITFGVLLVGILVNAAQSYRVNNGATVTINEWSVCKKVTNSTGKDIFVPTNSSNEWNQFRTYFPSGISLGTCATPTPTPPPDEPPEEPPPPTCSCTSPWYVCQSGTMCCLGSGCPSWACTNFCSSRGGVKSYCNGSPTCTCNNGATYNCSGDGCYYC